MHTHTGRGWKDQSDASMRASNSFCDAAAGRNSCAASATIRVPEEEPASTHTGPRSTRQGPVSEPKRPSSSRAWAVAASVVSVVRCPRVAAARRSA